MSALIGHAKAARILGEELMAAANEASRRTGDGADRVLKHAGHAYLRAADRMEQAMREEATGREDQP